MLEIGILKNFDSGTYEACVQLAGSLTTYFDNISVAKNIPSSAMVIGNYVILAIPGDNPKDACVIAAWPGGLVPRFTPKVTEIALWRRHDVCDSSFYAQINGTLTSTSVPYKNEVRELSLPDITGYPQWGKTILHNVTRGNSRKITGVNTSTNTISTESSGDDWADGDIITTGSQTCVYTAGHPYSRFFDIDISAEVPSTASAALLYFSTRNFSGTASSAQDQLCIHPWETYAIAKVSGQMCTAAYQSEVIWAVLPIVGQKFCLSFGTWGAVTASGMLAIVQLRGYWE